MKEYYKYIFIVLIYRTIDDFYDFYESLEKLGLVNYKIVIVNSFFDEKSNQKIKSLAYNYNCDFLEVENKGYGYGNNKGIGYIKKKYNYDYVIISNSDIIIEKFNIKSLDEVDKKSVIGPIILTSLKKHQNPYWVVDNKLSEYFIYKGSKCKNKIFFYLGILFNKILRETFLYFYMKSSIKKREVFALHGSFLILTKEILDCIGLPFNEKMFLFAEEQYLAHLLKNKGIKSFVLKDIKVFHKEDGSMKFSNIKEQEEAWKSIIIYYEELKRRR